MKSNPRDKCQTDCMTWVYKITTHIWISCKTKPYLTKTIRLFLMLSLTINTFKRKAECLHQIVNCNIWLCKISLSRHQSYRTLYPASSLMSNKNHKQSCLKYILLLYSRKKIKNLKGRLKLCKNS